MRDNGTGTSGLPSGGAGQSRPEMERSQIRGEEREEGARARELAAGGITPCRRARDGGKSGNPHDRIIALNKIKKIINTCLGTMFLSKLSLGDRGQLREVRGRLDLVESGAETERGYSSGDCKQLK